MQVSEQRERSKVGAKKYNVFDLACNKVKRQRVETTTKESKADMETGINPVTPPWDQVSCERDAATWHTL